MREWYFQVMGQELGPFTSAELKTRAESGQIQADTMVRRGAEGRWLFAEKVKGLLPVPPEPQPPSPRAGRAVDSATGSDDEVSTGRSTAGGWEASSTKPGSNDAQSQAETVKPISWSSESSSSRQVSVVTIPLNGDDDSGAAAQGPSSEFYDFVGFREAISPVLYRAVRQYLTENQLTMTQLNRRALAALVQRPELAGDLMISSMSVIPQKVNDKSNRDGSHPLADLERVEHATFRVNLFNTSSHVIEAAQGQFLPELVETRHYGEVGTKPLPPLDHKGHVHVSLNGVQQGIAVPLDVNVSVPPLAAIALTFWFRGAAKPSLTTIRGHLSLGEGHALAISEPFTIVMHGDSP